MYYNSIRFEQSCSNKVTEQEYDKPGITLGTDSGSYKR